MAPRSTFRLLKSPKFFSELEIPNSNQDNLIADLRVKERSTTENIKVKGIFNSADIQCRSTMFSDNITEKLWQLVTLVSSVIWIVKKQNVKNEKKDQFTLKLTPVLEKYIYRILWTKSPYRNCTAKKAINTVKCIWEKKYLAAQQDACQKSHK